MKTITELMEDFEIEVAKKIADLLQCFEENQSSDELTNDWYCGVTGQETSDDEFELERIGDHYDDKFPELDPDSICRTDVSSADVAIEVERIMKEKHGFDIGKRQNEPTDKHQIWVYLFRKVED